MDTHIFSSSRSEKSCGGGGVGERLGGLRDYACVCQQHATFHAGESRAGFLIGLCQHKLLIMRRRGVEVCVCVWVFVGGWGVGVINGLYMCLPTT